MSENLLARTEEYLDELLPRRDTVVRQMERYAAENDVPIVGPACARVLYQLARISGARRVFEMGSAIGYSTLWLARAVGERGTVYYTDGDSANVRRAQAYLKRAGVLDRVKLLNGDALELLRSTDGEFDLIFNDVNKDQYPEVFRLAVPRLHGRAARPAKPGDVRTAAVQKFNRMIYRSPRLFTTIIPLRDGLAVCERIR